MFKLYVPISYLSNMNDLAITCSDFGNALKMLICSEKKNTLFLELTMAIPRKW